MQKGFDVVNLHGTASGVIATPYIGENNNWWIGNEDTGISAKGTKGDPGCPGVQGPKGDKGDVGPAGPQGAQGASGPQGLKGDQGDIGPAGPQGLKGDQGLVGNDGIQGSKGDKGDTGPVGPQGPKGEDADVAELEKLKEDVVRIDSDLAIKTVDLGAGITLTRFGKFRHIYIDGNTVLNNTTQYIPMADRPTKELTFPININTGRWHTMTLKISLEGKMTGSDLGVSDFSSYKAVGSASWFVN